MTSLSKWGAFGALAASLVVVPGPTTAVAAPGSHTFEYTGAPQSFVVPDGVDEVIVDACGAQGQDLYIQLEVAVETGFGGRGGRATSVVDVVPGENLVVMVGGRRGYNGGGTGAASGGGSSDVRQGGDGLADRVVIGGGGGGGGGEYVFLQSLFGLSGGTGGGLVGSGDSPGTQTSAGGNGSLGVGGDAAVPAQPNVGTGRGGGGGGGLYGGGGGWAVTDGFSFDFGPGSGGSGLGDSHETGACRGDGSVTISYDEPLPTILPSGAAVLEGDTGLQIIQVPVRLSSPAALPVTIDWTTGGLAQQAGHAQAGSDFVAGSGVVTFDPGETEVFVPIEVLGDTDVEPALLWGEWGVVEFSNPVNATLDTDPFFGLGLFIVFDDD